MLKVAARLLHHLVSLYNFHMVVKKEVIFFVSTKSITQLYKNKTK